MKLTMKFLALFFGVMMLANLADVFAQSADDEVLASWDGVNYMVLYRTKDGHLIYKRSHTISDTDFYERETLSLDTVTSITMKKSDYLDEVFDIKVSTQEGAVLRERHTGGEKYGRQISYMEFQIPISEKAKADSVLEKLKSLTGK